MKNLVIAWDLNRLIKPFRDKNAARSEQSFTHDGVASHPGDKGMKAIADAIFRALTNHRKPQPLEKLKK